MKDHLNKVLSFFGKTEPNSKVFIDNKKIKITKDGYFVFGLGRDRKNNVIIKTISNGKTEIIEKIVLKRKYKIQKIDGLPEKKSYTSKRSL